MLSNLVLGPQGSTPAQDTGARVYWDRTVPGKAFGWILSLSQRGSCEDVGDTVTSYRKAAWLESPAVHPRGGDLPSPSLKDGFVPDGTLWSSFPTASINYIWAVLSYKKKIFFSLILVLTGTLTWGTF